MDQQNCIVVICGRKGSGKSSFARRILKTCPRIFIFDPLDEYDWCPNRFDDPPAVEDWLEWSYGDRHCAARFVPDDIGPDFQEICELVDDYGNLTFCVEETPLVTPNASFIPREFDRLVRTGRHRGINLLFIGQRSTELARRCTAAADFIVYFATREPRDLREIAERLGNEQADRVSQLGLHGYICFDVVNWRDATIEEIQMRLGAVPTAALASSSKVR